VISYVLVLTKPHLICHLESDEQHFRLPNAIETTQRSVVSILRSTATDSCLRLTDAAATPPTVKMRISRGGGGGRGLGQQHPLLLQNKMQKQMQWYWSQRPQTCSDNNKGSAPKNAAAKQTTRLGSEFASSPSKAPPLPTPRLSRTGSKNVPTEDANCCWCLCCCCCCCCGVAAAMLLLRCCYFATADVAASASAALAKAGKQQQVPVAQFSAFTWGLRDGVHWEKRDTNNNCYHTKHLN